MRGLKSTLALLVILIGLGAYIFFVDRNREIEDPNAKPKAYTSLSTDNIEELQVRNASGETTRLARAGDDWQLVEPVKAEADNGVVGTVTSNIGTLEVQRVVDENPTDLKQYGLEPARIEIGFRLRVGVPGIARVELYEKVACSYEGPRLDRHGDYLSRRLRLHLDDVDRLDDTGGLRVHDNRLPLDRHDRNGQVGLLLPRARHGCNGSDRKDGVSRQFHLLEVTADERFELRLRHAVVKTGPDE